MKATKIKKNQIKQINILKQKPQGNGPGGDGLRGNVLPLALVGRRGGVGSGGGSEDGHGDFGCGVRANIRSILVDNK